MRNLPAGGYTLLPLAALDCQGAEITWRTEKKKLELSACSDNFKHSAALKKLKLHFAAQAKGCDKDYGPIEQLIRSKKGPVSSKRKLGR